MLLSAAPESYCSTVPRQQQGLLSFLHTVPSLLLRVQSSSVQIAALSCSFIASDAHLSCSECRERMPICLSTLQVPQISGITTSTSKFPISVAYFIAQFQSTTLQSLLPLITFSLVLLHKNFKSLQRFLVDEMNSLSN